VGKFDRKTKKTRNKQKSMKSFSPAFSLDDQNKDWNNFLKIMSKGTINLKPEADNLLNILNSLDFLILEKFLFCL